MAPTSIVIQRPNETGFENCSAQCSARFFLVAIPSFAARAWMNEAITLLAKYHPKQEVAVLRPGLDVRGKIAGVDIGDAGNKGRTQERKNSTEEASSDSCPPGLRSRHFQFWPISRTKESEQTGS